MSLKLGNTTINKIYLGNTEIKKMYLGSTLVFDKTSQFLLDLYPATVAYSLRQLKTGVTNVVRVRRSSDNAEQDFTATQITDGTLLAFTGAGNGFVTVWYDQAEFDKVNLWTYSEDLTNSAWTKATSTIVSNTIANPLNGLVTADKINGLRVQRNVTLTAGITYTQSVYAKAGERTWCRLYNDGGSGGVYFDLVNGVVGSASGTCTGAISNAGGGWWRCSITFTPTSTASWQGLVFNAISNNVFASLNDSNGAFYWGFQLEPSSSPSIYAPTELSARPYNTTQTIQANQPQIVASGVLVTDNGKPALTFDGVNDTITQTTDITISMVTGVFNWESTTSYEGSISSTTTTGVNKHVFILNGLLYQLYTSTASLFTSPASNYWVNGVNTLTTGNGQKITTAGSNSALARLIMGRDTAGGSSSGCKMQEVIAYTNTANRTAIESNINSYYNIY